MKNRTLQVLLLAVATFGATAHCGKSGESSGTPPLGPTDVVVTWTFDGKPANGMECVGRGIASVVITLSATNDVALHQNTTVDCDKGTVTFAGLDTAALGTPFLEGTVIDGKGMTLTRADMTVVPTPGKTAVTLDFFPSMMPTTAASTSGDPATTSGDPATSSSGGGGMGGMGGMGASSAASTAASSSAASTAAATSGAGGAGGAP